MTDEPEQTLRLLRETRAEMLARLDGIDHRLFGIERHLGAARQHPATGAQAMRDGDPGGGAAGGTPKVER